ncbi:MAG TPA: hypothetical protein IGQ44_00170 [Geminocystis sp. M7585_C2015_104]|nr:hypothetical protein [Geminocystis sp. M7585_C2015_104]
MLVTDSFIILVCNGAEYKTVKRGLRDTSLSDRIIPIPIGIQAVYRFLETSNIDKNTPVILLGLAGSLSKEYSVGDVVVYDSCCYLEKGKLLTKPCNGMLKNYLVKRLNASTVGGITSDILLWESSQKKRLFQQSQAMVVDMESFAILSYFATAAVVRVVSDGVDDNLPQLNQAITPTGELDGVRMFFAFLRQPVRGIKLVKNSLISLRKLEAVVRKLGDGG